MTLMRTERAVRALTDADPDFVELCKVLYGPAVNADEIWQDVFGKRTGTLDPQERRNRTQARVGLASNVLGLTAGGAALGSALKDKRLERGGKVSGQLYRLGQRLPKSPLHGRVAASTLAAGALGLQAANVGGDAVANRVLSRASKKKVPVSKINLTALVGGQLKQARATINTHLGTAGGTVKPPPGPKAPPKPPAAQSPTTGAVPRSGGRHRADTMPAKAKSVGSSVGSAVNTLTATPGRKVATGATIGVAGLAARRSGPAASQDMAMYAPPTWMGQQPMAKRDDVLWEGEFSKFDEDQRLAFGWASVVEKDGLPVIDRQGDYMTADDLEKAAYDYVLRSRVGGDMHRRNETDAAHKVADMVESVVMTREKISKMGLPENTPVGWWVGFKIHDEPTWQLVKKGERTGFSIHGRGRRRETAVDELMGY